jgi:hypothetical protein
VAEIKLTLSVMKGSLAVCRLDRLSEIPQWALSSAFVSITRTLDELSIVCPQEHVPEGTLCEKEWKALQVAGPLGFTLVGILASLITPLALSNVSIFAISTYDTDYLLVKERDLEMAIATLSKEGHWISRLE